MLYKSEESLKKMIKKKIFSLVSSMEFMMLPRSSMEIANFVFVMTVVLKISSFPHVNAKVHAKAFMYNA